METVSPRSTLLRLTTALSHPMVQIAAPPPSLQRLAIGEKLGAFVLHGMKKGLAEIDTSFGKLQLATSFPLRIQTNIQLQIIGKLPYMQLLITSIQGQTPQSVLQLSTTNNSIIESGTKQVLATGVSSSAAHSVNPETIYLTVGTNAVATKTGITLTPPYASGAPTAEGINATSLIQGTGKNYHLNTQINRTFERFSVRITNVLPPSQLSRGGGLPSTGKENLAVGQSVTGVVTMTNLQGHSILQTHVGPISLTTPSLLPPSTTISFLITAALTPLTIMPFGEMAVHKGDIILETYRWPELEDAIRTLNDSHPTLGQHLLNSILPKTGPTFAASIIFLVSAIRDGDIRNWFGDAPVRALQRMKPELMSRLRDDFLQISQLSDDNTSSIWRSYPLPFSNGQEIEQIRLYIKRKLESDDDGADTPDQGTRFILDLDLTYLGRIQLDGLVRSSQKQFDLIFRTDNPLHQVLQNGIRNIFQKGIEETGHIGGLTFQASPEAFLDNLSDKTHPPKVGLIA